MSDVFRRGIMDRAEIKSIARLRFSENRWPMIGVCVIVPLIMTAVVAIPVLGLAGLLVSPLLSVMMAGFFLDCWRGEQPPMERLFQGAIDRMGTKLGGILWMELKVFLWTMLLVVPGIVKAYAYSLTPYLLARYPNVGAMEASELSDRITSGYKMEIFVMSLSFLGWILLSGFTFGLLAVFYVAPYMNTSMAGLCDELVQNALQEGRITPEMLGETV